MNDSWMLKLDLLYSTDDKMGDESNEKGESKLVFVFINKFYLLPFKLKIC